MKKAFLASFFLAIFQISFFSNSFAAAGEGIVVADFNNGEALNNMGNPVEVWLKEDGSDSTQSCAMKFVEEDALKNASGKSLQIDYDVDSPNPAYNGVRMGLDKIQANGYKTLRFYARGDSNTGFSPRLKIEIIGKGLSPSPYILEGISGEWQEFSIPLSSFFAVRDWNSLSQFVIVFADISSNPKAGRIYLDQIWFSKD